MVKSKVTIGEVVDFLNGLLKDDPNALTSLFSMRIPCNRKLADHETVQVGCEGNYWQVGMIGIFNGLFGKDIYGRGHISADYENGMIKKFRLLSDEDVKEIVESTR